MPHLKLDDKEFPLRVGELRVGGSAPDIPVAFGEGAAALAIIALSDEQSATIRRGTEATPVRVNGVALGEEPVPLIHGDRIEIAGRVLRFAMDATSGSTVVVPAFDAATAAPEPLPALAAAPAVRGGRLVSLVDGREYTVREAGLTIGRDAASDVVVASGEVSRRHAEIGLGPAGYLLTDHSRNGVLVNGLPVSRTHLLARGDVLKIGDEELRFHADVLSAPAPPAEVTPDVAVRPLAFASECEAEPNDASASAAARPAPLAMLEVVNAGVQRGVRYEIRASLTHVGRGDYNDIIISDDSVSESHAKLQRRETGWYIVDLDSTNGTYVAGKRVSGEQRLDGDVDVRFGGIKMIFHSLAPTGAAASGTRVIVGLKAPDPVRVGAAARGSATAATAPAPERRSSARLWRLLIPLVIVGASIFLALQGR